MKIVIITPTLFDKNSPFNHLFKDILMGLIDKDFEIVRIVATQNLEDDSYKMGIDSIEYIPFIRKSTNKNNIVGRYLADTSMCRKMVRLLRNINADYLLEDSSYVSPIVIKVARKLNMRVVLMLQDVWPDNAVVSGLVSQKGFIYRFFEHKQKIVYKYSQKIICISDDMKKFIAQKGVTDGKLSVIYNWGYSDTIFDIPWEKNQFVKKYAFKRDVFYVVYAGNVGKMQNVEIIIKAAKKLESNDKIRFLIVGDGANIDTIKEEAKSLKNIEFFPFQDSSLAPHVYSMAGVNIIPLVEGGQYTAMPSKTGVVLSCGRPLIVCFGKLSSFSQLLCSYKAGASVSATNENELVEEILKLSEKEQTRNVGSDRLFSLFFTRSSNIKKYIDEFVIENSCI